MKIYIGGLGSALSLKDYIFEALVKKGYEVYDLNKESTELHGPSYLVGKAVSEDPASKGIVLCGNGFGAQHLASLHKGTRVINCIDVKQVESGRIINDANILALGARLIDTNQVMELVSKFLDTPFGQDLSQEKIADLLRSFEIIERNREALKKA